MSSVSYQRLYRHISRVLSAQDRLAILDSRSFASGQKKSSTGIWLLWMVCRENLCAPRPTGTADASFQNATSALISANACYQETSPGPLVYVLGSDGRECTGSTQRLLRRAVCCTSSCTAPASALPCMFVTGTHAYTAALQRDTTLSVWKRTMRTRPTTSWTTSKQPLPTSAPLSLGATDAPPPAITVDQPLHTSCWLLTCPCTSHGGDPTHFHLLSQHQYRCPPGCLLSSVHLPGCERHLSH